MHQAGAHSPSILRPLLGDERAAHRPLAADADAGEHTKERELPDARRDGAEAGKRRIAENRQHQRSHAAEAIRNRPPHHRQAPADQEQRKQHRAVIHHNCGRRGLAGSRQQLGERRDQHERVDERIHPVECPAAPRGPEAARLIPCQRRARSCDCDVRLHAHGPAVGRPIIIARMRLLSLFLAIAAVSAAAQEATNAPAETLLNRDILTALDAELSGTAAKDHVAQLTLLHRVPASPGFHDAIEYVLSRAKAYGLSDVHVETFPGDGTTYFGTLHGNRGWRVEGGLLDEVAPRARRITSYDDARVAIADNSESASVAGAALPSRAVCSAINEPRRRSRPSSVRRGIGSR